LPSQQQVRWAQLRVGLTVIFAALTLGVLIFLMTGTTGLFTPRIDLVSYCDSAGGLRVGAPVRLHGVDIGNVSSITIVPGRPLSPVEVRLRVSARFRERLRKDTTATLTTQGVLGETFVNLDSRTAQGPPAEAGDELATLDAPSIEDVVRGTQTTLQNLDVLLKRMDGIVAHVEKGEGSVGKFLYDPGLFNRVDATLKETERIITEVGRGHGTVGKLLSDEELYNKISSAMDRVNRMLDEVEQGQGTLGRFLKDPSLYDQANQTISKANQLMDDIQAGRGTLGMVAKDPEFAKKIDNMVTQLSSLVQRMESGDGTIGRLMRDPSIYQNADQMLVETRTLIQAIRENPRRYLTIRFRLF
jgi:phospholipid/cholesterol/gamma-HCH transport system substrate-binding protein